MNINDHLFYAFIYKDCYCCMYNVCVEYANTTYRL